MFRRNSHWAHGGCRPSFGSWAGRGRFFGPGEVRLAILSLLAEGPQHGYELMKLLAQRSGGIYRASAGTIYPTLQQLEDEGVVVAQAQEGKRVYQITDEGRRELHREEDAVNRIWRRAKVWNEWRAAFDPEVQEIVRPAERVMKAAFSAMSGASSSSAEKIREILERALRDLEDLGGKQ